jgi:leader peptidase (prepilin peptidase) / N-methyltransferase
MTAPDSEIVVIITGYLMLVALLVGSFINLAADRLPRRESLVRPRSHCRACGRVLNFVDLIPVGGYLIRGGRCASCGVSIGASAPAVEALCGALMVTPLVLFGLVPGAVAGVAAIAVAGVAVVGLSFARPQGR